MGSNRLALIALLLVAVSLHGQTTSGAIPNPGATSDSSAAPASNPASNPDTDTLLDTGYKLYDAGNYAAAAHYFQVVLQSDPNNDQVPAQLGFAYLHLNENDKAKAEFERVAKGTDRKLRDEAMEQLKYMQPAPDSDAATSRNASPANANPQNPDLATQAFQLYDAGKYAQAAKDFQTLLASDPTNYAVAAQLGYADLNLQRDSQALAAFRIAAATHDVVLGKQVLAEIKLLAPPSIYFDIYGDSIYLGRFNDVVGDLQTRLGKSIGNRTPWSIYWGNSFTRDSSSKSGVFPAIFADNVYMSGLGILFQPSGKHYSVYGEANWALNLLDYPGNTYTSRSDLRIVATYDNLIHHHLVGPIGALTLFKLDSDRLYTFMDGSAGYYSRYFGDGIAYGQLQEGLRLGHAGYFKYLGYARYNLAADTIHEFYNNFVEIGPGLAVQSTKERVDVMLETEFLYGIYFGSSTASTPNPYGLTYNEFRVTLVFGHRF